MSLTVGKLSASKVSGPAAFAKIGGGGIMVGGVLSVMVAGFELGSGLDIGPDPPPPPPPPE